MHFTTIFELIKLFVIIILRNSVNYKIRFNGTKSDVLEGQFILEDLQVMLNI